MSDQDFRSGFWAGAFAILASPVVLAMAIGALAAFAGTGYAIYLFIASGLGWVVPIVLIVPILILVFVLADWLFSGGLREMWEDLRYR